MDSVLSAQRTARLMEWLNEGTCNYMAVAVMRMQLEQAGFTFLPLGEAWRLKPGGKYYTERNDSSIFAFVAGDLHPEEGGFHIIAAHSDSPCFKVKPNPEIYGDGGVVSLNVEKYGGGIMYTWFDRPLSISGRAVLRGDDVLHPEVRVFDADRPIAEIPHLAIHFNRGVNEGNPLSVQKDMKPVLGIYSREEFDELQRQGGVLKSIVAETVNCSPQEILSFEACLYPYESAKLTGAHDEFIMSGRLDDLSMAYAALEAMVSSCGERTAATRVMAIFDNEETGSHTRQGAAAPTLKHILKRICLSMPASESNARDEESFYRALENSFLISADDAHAWHPNYNEKYDPTNHPVIGGGPVVKINANCKYMTDARGDAIFRGLCEVAGVECQYFVNHGDVAGGSTLGNILTSQLDIAGVDMGCAIWAMHSACETAGIDDHLDTVNVFETFYKS